MVLTAGIPFFSRNNIFLRILFIAVTGGAGDLSAMAANLYEALRSFDDKAATVLFAETVEEAGLGVAVMNRLKKAAGGKITCL